MTPTTTTDLDVLDIPAVSALDAINRGEIDIQVATAKRYPRSLVTFRQRALEMATLDQATAESCIYALPRDGKTIEGPSARLAEVIASAFGHMRVEGRAVNDDGKFITARGTAWDIQNNNLRAIEVQRRITDKNGRRYKDDMIVVTANAAISIAIRNAITAVIPKPLWLPIYDACRKTAVGDASTLVNRRAAMLDYFLKLGASHEKVFALLGIKGVDDISLEHLGTLKGLATTIKEGDTTVDEAFAPTAAAEPLRVARKSDAAPAPPAPVTTAAPATPTPSASTAVVTDEVTAIAHVINVDLLLAVATIRSLNGTATLTIEVERHDDLQELAKFSGTDHQLRIVCVRTAKALRLVSFAIAD